MRRPTLDYMDSGLCLSIDLLLSDLGLLARQPLFLMCRAWRTSNRWKSGRRYLQPKKRGIQAEVICDGMATIFEVRKVARMREKNQRADVQYI